jgi:hypothetical protein
MQKKALIGTGRGGMFSGYLGGLFVASILLVLLHFLTNLSFQKIINPFALILFSIFFFPFFIIAFLKFLDKKPLLIISDNGISMRKHRLPFAGLEQIEWTDVAGYSAKINRLKNGSTKFLIVERKSRKKKYYVDLFDLNVNGDVLGTLKSYARKYNFNQ